MSDRVLTLRELNRATLARQLLLERVSMPATALLEHLVGLQAQEANSWYGGFWSRLEAFDPGEVSALLEERAIVRIALMRSTIHLVTTEDALRLRPLLQPAVAKPLTGHWRRHLAELHAEEVASAAREAFAEHGPLTNAELGALLQGRWDGPDASDVAMGARVWVPLAQVPPRGLWGRSGAARHLPLESWAGRPLGPALPAEELVLRYLAAFGPATPADAQAWSGLTRLRAVFERLRPQLAVFRDEAGRELFDLPDAPRPGPDVPAPPRFLYDYDNLMLGHADRTRFGSSELRAEVLRRAGMYAYGSLLVNGFLGGLWRIERGRGTATLVVRLAQPLDAAGRDAVTREGAALLRFWAPEVSHEMRFSPLSEVGGES